jgi:hypothetical protein
MGKYTDQRNKDNDYKASHAEVLAVVKSGCES